MDPSRPGQLPMRTPSGLHQPGKAQSSSPGRKAHSAGGKLAWRGRAAPGQGVGGDGLGQVSSLGYIPCLECTPRRVKGVGRQSALRGGSH